ncbi:MAG: hypothetical protein KGY55_03715 [Candidatus Thermoplasmatota archaeon]|nr:hypothetical protein [Candidatus Thermoplasmatota archaeon]
MNVKRWATLFIGLIAPWLIIIAALATETYTSVWLYVGPLAWFLTAAMFALALYE